MAQLIIEEVVNQYTKTLFDFYNECEKMFIKENNLKDNQNVWLSNEFIKRISKFTLVNDSKFINDIARLKNININEISLKKMIGEIENNKNLYKNNKRYHYIFDLIQ